MSNDIYFIQDLLDEGLLSSEIAAEDYHYNDSLIGEENMKLYKKLIHHRCAINQSSLSGWAWLIGSAGGSLKPLLCATRKRDTCGLHELDIYDEGNAHIVSFQLLVAACFLFSIVNLFTLAVWSRCKSPPTAQTEVSIQLFMLKLFSILDIVGCLSPVEAMLMFLVGDKVRVLSVLHAILFASFENFCVAAYILYLLLKSFWTFLATIFLVEHSHPTQRVLLFASLRRAQVLLAAPLLVCLVPCAVYYLFQGSLYCVHEGRAYLMSQVFSYARLPHGLFHVVHDLDKYTQYALQLLAFILLIVFASKRRFAICRGSPSPGQASDSVAYVPQWDEDVEEEEEKAETSEPSVVIEHGPSMPEGSALADELRRLIFWQQVACVCRGVMHYSSQELSYYLSYIVYLEYYPIEKLVNHMALYGLAPMLSTILSATFRSGLVSIISDLKAAAMRPLQRRRPW